MKVEESKLYQELRSSEEEALALVEMEKAKCKAALEAAEAAQKIAELEAQKRLRAEWKAKREFEERRRASETDLRYRRYSIDDIEAATHKFDRALKIGEGGYGPVYKAVLDHTNVAIKILRPDASQGRKQFQQEVNTIQHCKSQDLHSYAVIVSLFFSLFRAAFSTYILLSHINTKRIPSLLLVINMFDIRKQVFFYLF